MNVWKNIKDISLSEILKVAEQRSETLERENKMLRKKVGVLEEELALLKEDNLVLDDRFDLEAFKLGKLGTARRYVCERPKYNTGCGSCASCDRNLRIAKRLFPENQFC